MENVVEKLKENLDYENNYYFYHETSYGYGEDICNEGLLLSGDNILDVDNLLYTTTCVLDDSLTENDQDFANFLRGEKSASSNRPITEIVILGVPKDEIDYAVTPLLYKKMNHQGMDANFVVDSSYVLGYIDLTKELLITNENYFDYNENYTY